MTQRVDFYVLPESGESACLEMACRIAGKAFRQGMQIYLQTQSVEQAKLLDSMLWSTPKASFLPHAIYPADGVSPDRLHVLVGHCDPPENWNEFLISLTEEVPQSAARFSRVADLIGGDAQQKQSGRLRFRSYRENGIEPTTHKI
ncbi:MAG: DNA polymerase III subunit chi [Acidiferrobacterales bacterium]|nr:DNA polymerase III subunit chi [Acidiferrobacterales bacterium]